MNGYILGALRDGWKSTNTEQKLCLLGYLIGMFLFAYFFLYVDIFGVYGKILAIAGFVTSMVCAFLYSIFQYLPIFKKSRNKSSNNKSSNNKSSNKTLSDFE